MGKCKERFYLVLKDGIVEVYDDWDICLRYITGVENRHYKISDRKQLLETVRQFYSHGQELAIHFKEHRQNVYMTPDDFSDFLDVYKTA